MKLKPRLRVTFTEPSDIEVVVRGMLGQGTAAIMAATGLSASQVQYRLTKAKLADGLPSGHGYRRQWRDGTSPLSRQILGAMAPRLRVETRDRLPKRIGLPRNVIPIKAGKSPDFKLPKNIAVRKI